MKNLILNLLSFSALALFFILATATSQEEDFGSYKMKIERNTNGIIISNEDNFDYTSINVSVTTVDTFKIDSVVFKSFSPQDPVEIKSNESDTLFFSDLKTSTNEFASDTLKRFSVSVDGNCPDHDFCGFSKFFN